MRKLKFIRRGPVAMLFLASALVFLALRLEMPAAFADRLNESPAPEPSKNPALWGATTEQDWKGFPHKAQPTNAAWGHLDKVRVELEFPNHETLPDPEFWKALPWVFEVESLADVNAVFARANLSSNQLASLTNPARIKGSKGFFEIQPTPETVLSLSPESRSVIYYELAKSDLNPFHRTPFSVPHEFFHGWLNDSGLDDAVHDRLQKLAYPRGESMCFSDLHVFADLDQAKRLRLMMTLSRVPSLTVNLKVDAHSDINALSRYWGVGGRQREVRAMLEASAQVHGGSRIAIASLLPRFARTRLYTYPHVVRGPERPGPDCFWTALNFFNDHADEAGFDDVSIPEHLEREYSPATGPLHFGDVIILKDHRGMYLHACVYIADNLVFTKNGASYHQPWTLQDIDDMCHGYLITQEPGKKISFEVYRPRSS